MSLSDVDSRRDELPHIFHLEQKCQKEIGEIGQDFLPPKNFQ